jgi:hypothetical protein
MKRRLASYGVCAGVVLCLLCLPLLPAAAQEGQEGKASEPGAAKSKPQPIPKGGPAEFGSRAQPAVSHSTLH